MIKRSEYAHRLTKMSSPGWEKVFPNEKTLRECLWQHICIECRDDDDVDVDSPAEDMLATACGQEFMYDKPLKRDIEAQAMADKIMKEASK